MSAVFSIRVGDRLPYLAYKFPFSLVGATGVEVSVRDNKTGVVFINRQPGVIANGTYVIDGVSTALTPADGVAFYPWSSGDTAAEHRKASALFHVIWPGALQETLPSEGYESVSIMANF